MLGPLICSSLAQRRRRRRSALHYNHPCGFTGQLPHPLPNTCFSFNTNVCSLFLFVFVYILCTNKSAYYSLSLSSLLLLLAPWLQSDLRLVPKLFTHHWNISFIYTHRFVAVFLSHSYDIVNYKRVPHKVRLHVAAVVTSRHQLGLEEGHQLVHGWPLCRQCMPTFLHLLAEVLWAL